MTQAVALAQQASTGVSQGFKNRIINGAMVIDQRNAGTYAAYASSSFIVDRFKYIASQASKFVLGQNLGTAPVTPPAGFTNYIGAQVNSAVSISSSDYFFILQGIEGYNMADLNWGSSSAKTATLSFWVRSSLTGTFGGSIGNVNGDRSYPFSYTISSANTWEYKTVTITGDTTGTWNTTNGAGAYLYLGLGVGSTYSGTAGAWAGSNLLSSTGATSVVGTNGATWYITGVQFEVGSSATSFETRSYGTELMLCQRYCFSMNGAGVSGNADFGSGGVYSNVGYINIIFPVTPRVPPTGITVNSASNYGVNFYAGQGGTCNSVTFSNATFSGMRLAMSGSGASASNGSYGQGAFIGSSGILYTTGSEL